MKSKTRISNTAKTDSNSHWVLGGNPAAIMQQEARGQHELINSIQLPVEVRGNKELLESAGVEFGEPLKGDLLFCNAKLPEGWEKRAVKDADARWSELVDDSGVVRATIFYKAAFYDRYAFMNVE